MKSRTLVKRLFITISFWGFLQTAGAQILSQDDLTADTFGSVDVIENIECKNNTHTDCGFIKKQLLLNVGQKVDDKKLNDSKTKLKLLGLFKKVHLFLEKGSVKGKVRLVVDVNEASSIYTVTSLTAGADVFSNSKDSAFGQMDFTVGHRNLFGTGKNLSASVSTFTDQMYAGYVGSVLLRYNDPNFFGSKKWFFNIDLFSQSDNRGDYRGEEYLASVEFGRRFGKFSYFTLGAVSQISNNDVRNDPSLGNYKNQFFRQYYSIGYGYNTQDDLFFPTQGARFDIKILIPGQEKLLGGVDQYIDNDLIGDVDFSVVGEVARNWYISLFAESRNRFFDQDNFLNTGIGTEIAYQSRHNQTEKDISDIRYFIAPAFTSYSGWDGSEASIAAGVKLRHKDYGLIRLQVVGGGLWDISF